jgi:hypothetical protein
LPGRKQETGNPNATHYPFNTSYIKKRASVKNRFNPKNQKQNTTTFSLKQFLFVLIASFILFSCDLFPWSPGNKYSIGHFPKDPVNLEEINTEYDDYNSDIPVFGETFPFCFSSNRDSHGNHFDIVYKLMSVYFSKKTGELDIYENTQSNLDVYIRNSNIRQALNKINTSHDELGPYSIPIGEGFFSDGNGYQSFQNYIFLYANNENGNYNIKLTHNTLTNRYDTIINMDYLNSKAQDFYPTLNTEKTKIYWSSNRDGPFNIYFTELDQTGDILIDMAHGGGYPVIKDDVLNSEDDDKCPSITNQTMVFASNRKGGFGGYDLYYSYFENGEWSEPVHFGREINTEYDEYRPIVRSQPWEFDNDMMIFSSNRPGGKGGFDLYYVGIEREIKTPDNTPQ